ncbi:MAG: NifB/NifX family molybdenum-iron cluster-binding protein [Acidobacteriota bacterium]
MKIALPVLADKGIDSIMDIERLGRAFGYIVYDVDEGAHEYVENVLRGDGVDCTGVSCIEMLLDEGVDEIVTCHIGPKVMQFLDEKGIPVFMGEPGKIGPTIEKHKNGQLQEAMF